MYKKWFPGFLVQDVFIYIYKPLAAKAEMCKIATHEF